MHGVDLNPSAVEVAERPVFTTVSTLVLVKMPGLSYRGLGDFVGSLFDIGGAICLARDIEACGFRFRSVKSMTEQRFQAVSLTQPSVLARLWPGVLLTSCCRQFRPVPKHVGDSLP